MSWEYLRYEARCKVCGHVGVCVKGSDDWNRSSTTWEGFVGQAPDSTAVARKRVDSRDLTPLCRCGSTQVAVDRFFGAS